MKKIIVLLLAVAMTATLLVGCGGSQASDTSKQANSGSTTTAAAPSVTPASEIQFWYCLSGSLGDEVLKLVDRFNKSQDKIKVTPVFQGKYDEASGKLQQALVSNTQPAVTMVECHYYYLYDATSQFADLTSYMKRDGVDASDFFEGFMPANLSSKPGVYGLPFNRSTMIMYYNKDMFKEVGLDPNKPPTTWDELHADAQKLAIPGSRWGFTTPTEVWPLQAFIGQAGGKMLNDKGTDIGFADGSGASALKFWLDMKNDGSMKVNAANAFGMTTQDFEQKRVGILWQSTAELAGIMKSADFDFGAAFLPKGVQMSTPTGGTNLAIPANCTPEQKEAAWEFIKFATSVDQIYQFSAATGYAPTRKSCSSNQQFQELWNKYPAYKVSFDQLQYAKDTTNNAHWAQVESALWSVQQGMLLDTKYTPEQAVDEMSKAAQKTLK